MLLFCSHNDFSLNQFLSHCRHPLQVERSVISVKKILIYIQIIIIRSAVFSLFVNFIFYSGSVGRECCICVGTYRNWTILVNIFVNI